MSHIPWHDIPIDFHTDHDIPNIPKNIFLEISHEKYETSPMIIGFSRRTPQVFFCAAAYDEIARLRIFQENGMSRGMGPELQT